MNAPVKPYELYRVILDYEALQDGFLDRIDDLNTTLEQIDMAGEFAKGEVQKHLTKSSGRLRRGFGWESLGKMLKGTGLALVLVVDDERFAPTKEQLAKRRRRREQANARSTRPTWLFTKKVAREMGTKRWSSMTPAQQKRSVRKAGKASALARRRKARHGVPQTSQASTLAIHPQNSPEGRAQAHVIVDERGARDVGAQGGESSLGLISARSATASTL